jgi:hypothetical protein
MGPLCSTCSKNDNGRSYSMLAFKFCVLCPSFNWNLIKILSIILTFTLFVGVLIHFSHLEAHNLLKKGEFPLELPLSEFLSIYLKILTNHIQILNVIRSIDVSWPKFSETFLDYQSAIGDLSSHIVSLECLYIGKRLDGLFFF